jgi:SSS family solute:Na+ symporter
MVVGGFFLYLAYYGCDQSQAQRLFTSSSVREGQRGLFLNGLLRFPFALLYCLLGVALAAFLATHPEFAARVPADRPDYLVPMFVLEFFPAGLVGLVVAAIFAASMSSFDSAFNSLSAVTLRNLLGGASPDESAVTVARSRAWTAAWGLVCTALGYAMSRSGATVIELINMIGSAFYGPTLALFAVGLFARRATERGALAGLAAGVATNTALWLFAPGVSWLWWNAIGFVVAASVGYSLWREAPGAGEAESPPAVHFPRFWTLALLGGFLLMITVCLLVETALLGAGR